MKDPYSILGVSPGASDDEVKNAYRNLARRYHPDNYDDNNPLKELAKEKMQEINAAYDEIQRDRTSSTSSSSSSGSGYNYGYTQGNSSSGIYTTIRQRINERKYREAEELLASVSEYDRTADWHFLNSVCLMQRGKTADAMRELELACTMDPSNQEYQKAKEMFNTAGSRYGSTYYGEGGRRYRSTSDEACDCCMNLICLDCLCECMGGDLIRCI
ncbi:MAG: DnaJ domain-containing protein [Clostridia bacterium]|nr:DnaJ domain-containing protein [Clostridia bacterium]